MSFQIRKRGIFTPETEPDTGVAVWWCGVVDATAPPTVYIRLGVPGSRTGTAQWRCLQECYKWSDCIFQIYYRRYPGHYVTRVTHRQPGWNCTLRSSQPDKTVTDDAFLRGHLLAAKADQTPIRLAMFL